MKPTTSKYEGHLVGHNGAVRGNCLEEENVGKNLSFSEVCNNISKMSNGNFEKCVRSAIAASKGEDQLSLHILKKFSPFLSDLEEMAQKSPERRNRLSNDFAMAVMCLRDMVSAAHKQGAICAQIGLEPNAAPELYSTERRGRNEGESIVDFLRRVWGGQIAQGQIRRADLLRLDPKAYQALADYLRKNALPEDLAGLAPHMPRNRPAVPRPIARE